MGSSQTKQSNWTYAKENALNLSHMVGTETAKISKSSFVTTCITIALIPLATGFIFFKGTSHVAKTMYYTDYKEGCEPVPRYYDYLFGRKDSKKNRRCTNNILTKAANVLEVASSKLDSKYTDLKEKLSANYDTDIEDPTSMTFTSSPTPPDKTKSPFEPKAISSTPVGMSFVASAAPSFAPTTTPKAFVPTPSFVPSPAATPKAFVPSPAATPKAFVPSTTVYKRPKKGKKITSTVKFTPSGNLPQPKK